MVKNESEKISDSELENIINLAKLSVKREEFEGLKKEMASIIEFAQEVTRAGDGGEDFDSINDLSNVFREDVVEESFSREKILSNAGGGRDGFFYVKHFNN